MNMNIRTALLYRKNLATLIEESGIANLSPANSTYLSAAAPKPSIPPRLLCSACGYLGSYKCTRCAMPFCDRHCQALHNEVCERPLG
jgi:zinc finger HIT domain-containing protein 1